MDKAKVSARIVALNARKEEILKDNQALTEQMNKLQTSAQAIQNKGTQNNIEMSKIVGALEELTKLSQED